MTYQSETRWAQRALRKLTREPFLRQEVLLVALFAHVAATYGQHDPPIDPESLAAVLAIEYRRVVIDGEPPMGRPLELA